MQCLDMIQDALLAVTDNVGHYEAFKKTDRYIVWSEDGGYSGHGDNKPTTRIITGTTHLFTKMENDPFFEEIENAFSGIDIAWRLNSVQYEDSTGYTHYEWAWEVVR